MAALGGALTIGAFLHYAAVVGFVVTVPMVLFSVLSALAHAVLGAVRRPDWHRERLRVALGWGAYWALLTMAVLVGKRVLDTRLERALTPLRAQLAAQRAERGRYPDAVAEIDAASRPGGARCVYQREVATDAPAAEHYCITCVTFGVNHRSFCSDAAGGRDWD